MPGHLIHPTRPRCARRRRPDRRRGPARALAACLLLASALAPALAAPLQRTLPNGLRLVVERHSAAPVAAVRLYVHTGSAHEGAWAGSGVSHLVEHTVLRGSERYSLEQVRDTTLALGERLNAWTSRGATCYHVTTAADLAPQALELLADLVLAPTLSEESLAAERQIVAREIAMGQDEPGRVVHNLFFSTLFTRHPQRHPIIGYAPAMVALSDEQVRGYHQARYAPENTVAVLVGDFDPARMLERAAEVLGVYPARGAQPQPQPPEPPLTSTRVQIREQEELQRAWLILGWPTVSLFSEDLWALDLLAAVLGRGESSRLVAELVHEQGLADSVWCGSDTPDYEAGSLRIGAVCDPQRVEEVVAAALAQVQQVREQGVTEAELDRARRLLRAGKVYAEQTAVSRAESLGLGLLLAGDAQFDEYYLQRLEQVTPAQVQAAAERYADPQVYALATLRPPAEAAEAAPTPTARRPRSRLLTLPNGLRVVLTSQPGSGAVQLVTATRAGLRFEAPGQAGLSNLCAQMLTRGAAGRSRAALAQELEDRGAKLDAYSGRNSLGLTGQALAEDAELLLARAADSLQRPDFPAAELERLREQTLAALARQQDSPHQVASLLVGEALFGEHPYRYPAEGEPESVAALQREDLVAFHAAVCRPAETVLVVDGDLSPARAEELVRRYFGNWQAPGESPPDPAPPLPPPEPVVVQRQRAQAQALVYLSWLGPRVQDPDRVLWDLLAAALNARGSGGPLFPPLRDAGLVYAAGAFLIPGLDRGQLVVYAATEPGQEEEVRGRMEAALAGLREAPLPEATLQPLRRAVITRHQLGLAEPLDRAQTQALDELYTLGYDWHRDYPTRVAAVTGEQLQALAREALAPSQAVTVITGPGPAQEDDHDPAAQ